MKKLLLLLTLFAGGLFGAGCDNDEQLQGHYNYEATVLYKGVDCHDTYLISLKNLDESSDITEGIYYADNLAPEFKVDGLKIYLNCRQPTINDVSICTTLGPTYHHVVVTSSAKAEE